MLNIFVLMLCSQILTVTLVGVHVNVGKRRSKCKGEGLVEIHPRFS